MHVLFVHRNFPAQFGHIAKFLTDKHNVRCTFISEKPPGKEGNFERIQYQPAGGARQQTHPSSRTFENQIWHTQAIFDQLRKRPDVKPDLIVGHSGFASTLFLRELYDCPIINYFEYFYRTRQSDMDFRSDLPGPSVEAMLRARARNAMLLLDLENCDAGYSPTNWQRERLPQEFQHKLSTIFDGIDEHVWQPAASPQHKVGTWEIPTDKRVVTYVSRGMESMRGFDIFMRVAKRLCELRDDVVFYVVGEDRVAYGGDLRFTDGKSFKQWVLSQDDYDLSRILFTGRISGQDLANLFTVSDLHIYLTAPFVLSWSLMDALACEATVLASDTAPVREMVQHGHNGLLADFFDVDSFVEQANQVLDDPKAFAGLGKSARQGILDNYTLDKCLTRMLELYQKVCG